jgi:peptidoglycan/LPS O-acetylase OafA/YrhL
MRKGESVRHCGQSFDNSKIESSSREIAQNLVVRRRSVRAESVNLLRHLSRITTPGRTFIPQIDGMRFVAILCVIAYHTRNTAQIFFNISDDQSRNIVSNTFYAGHYGVHLFFVISGFILSLPFAKQYLIKDAPRIRLRDYYFRRLTRIEPPYVIQLIAMFLLCAFVLRYLPTHAHLYHNPDWARYASSHIFASLFYSNGFVFGAHPYPNFVLWSLEVEVQFYLVAPFLAKVFNISRAGLRRAVMVSAMVATPILLKLAPADAYWAANSLLGNLQFFLAGFLLTDFFVMKKLTFASRGFKWDILWLAASALVVVFGNYQSSAYVLPWLILLGCLGGFQGVFGSWFLSQPLIVTIGGMCYTIYLYHNFIISTAIRGTVRLHFGMFWLDVFIQLLLIAPIVFLVSAGLFALFERPFMRKDWPQTFWAFVRGKKSPAGPIVGKSQTMDGTLSK